MSSQCLAVAALGLSAAHQSCGDKAAVPQGVMLNKISPCFRRAPVGEDALLNSALPGVSKLLAL